MKRLILSSIALLLLNCSAVQQSETKTDSTPKVEAIKKEVPQTKPSADLSDLDDLGGTAPEPIQPLELPSNLNKLKVTLGNLLFHDPMLSSDNTLSCASCHGLDTAGAEHSKVSTGIKGQQGPINAPTVYNSGFYLAQFWDGRAKDLKEQAGGPVNNPIEMGSNWDEVLSKLKNRGDYKIYFDQIYGGVMNGDNIQDAIAEFERSLVTINSPFDRYLKGDLNAISEQAKKGYDTFKSVGCTSCHNGPAVGGTSYQKMGLVKDYFSARGGALTDADLGRYNVTKNEDDKHFFKVPSLRVAVLSWPYFHDASVDKIEDAIRIMGRHQLGVELSDEQIANIKAFLESLVGEYNGKSLATK